MNTTKILFLVVSLYSNFLFSAQPNDGKKADGAAAANEQQLIADLKKENALWKNALQALSHPALGLVASTGVTPKGPRVLKLNPTKNTLVDVTPQANPQTPMEQLATKLAAFRASVDSRFEDFEAREKEVLQIIHENAATIKTMRNGTQQTPLMLCVKFGCTKAIQKILAMGAALNDLDAQGRTALVYCFDQNYTTLIAQLAIKMKEKHQAELFDAMRFAKSVEVVDQVWPFLDLESQMLFAERTQTKNPIYRNIYKSFPSLLRQRKEQLDQAKKVSQMGRDVLALCEQHSTKASQQSGAAMTPQEKEQLAVKQAAQKRRKDAKKLKAQEEATKIAAKLKQKEEADAQELALAEKRRIREEHEQMLAQKALKFQLDHAEGNRSRRLKTAIANLRENARIHKQNEKIAQKRSKKIATQHAYAFVRKSFHAWHENIRDMQRADKHALILKAKRIKRIGLKWKEIANEKRALNSKADAFIQRRMMKAWLAKTRELQLKKDAELNMRLLACQNSLALLDAFEKKKTKAIESENAIDRAKVNLLLSASRLVRLYADYGFTVERFSASTKALDIQGQQFLATVGKRVGTEYSFDTSYPMLPTLFKNAASQQTKEAEEMYQLFDAVRSQDSQRTHELLATTECQQEDLALFRKWLSDQIQQHNKIPSDAMVQGAGVFDIMGWLHMETKYGKKLRGTALALIPEHDEPQVSRITEQSKLYDAATYSSRPQTSAGSQMQPHRAPNRYYAGNFTYVSAASAPRPFRSQSKRDAEYPNGSGSAAGLRTNSSTAHRRKPHVYSHTASESQRSQWRQNESQTALSAAAKPTARAQGTLS